jgi:hypothetical protein
MGVFTTPRLLSLASGVLLGVAAHLGVFIHGEWHVHAPQLIISHVFVVLCLALCRAVLQDSYDPGLALLVDRLGWIFVTYPLGLFGSILVYRASRFHRLTAADFPGPFGARLSKLWHVWQCRDSRNHEVLDRLHQKYGDFVRTGKSLAYRN